MELGFAGLHQLLLPHLGAVATLPPPQRDALSSAFGLLDREPPDRFLVALATLTLLAHTASERGLLCLVDDAQWLDRESAAVLAFVARRLHADAVAILVAVREPSDRPAGFAGLPDIQVEGLPAPEARQLLAARVPGLDNGVGKRIVAQTQGNPLALIEAGRELTPGHSPARGRCRLAASLPAGGRVPAADPSSSGRYADVAAGGGGRADRRPRLAVARWPRPRLHA